MVQTERKPGVKSGCKNEPGMSEEEQGSQREWDGVKIGERIRVGDVELVGSSASMLNEVETSGRFCFDT